MKLTLKSKTLLGGAFVVSSLTICYRILGFARESITAAFLGNTSASDAYYTAYSIPYILINIIALGAIASAAIPYLSKFIETGDIKGLNRFVNSTLSLMLPVLFIAAAAAYAAADAIVRVLAPGFGPETHKLCVSLTKIMILIMFPLGLSGLYAAVATAGKNFAISPLSFLAFNAVMVAGGALAYRWQNINIMAYSVITAAFAQFILTLFLTLKQTGIKIGLRFGRVDENVKAMLASMVPVSLSLILGSMNAVIARGFASGLDAGSIASLNYADKIFNLPLGIVIAPVTIALLPFLSDYVNNGNTESVINTYTRCIYWVFVIIMPVILIMLLLGKPIIALLFERGNFDGQDTVRTAGSLIFYALALPGAAVASIQYRIFYAYKNTKLPMFITLINIVINIAVAFALTPRMGQVGIACALAASNTAAALLSGFILRKKYLPQMAPLNKKLYAGLLLLSALTFTAVYFPCRVYTGNYYSLGTASRLGLFALLSLLCCGIYATLLQLFKVTDVKGVFLKLKRRFSDKRTAEK